MPSCSNSEIRRCRPLLGTFVEITASGLDEAALHGAVNAAFAALERIQNLMSVHDPDSELSLVNREAAHHPVKVSRETFAVLRHANTLASESGGAFDYTIAPTLARWGLLPKELERKAPGSWRQVQLLSDDQVSFLQPLAIDLGGIAKGFAVDAAIDTLRAQNVTAAVVNAGGDLRVFGSQPSTVHLRHPSKPQTFGHTLSLKASALATSSPCFSQRTWNGQKVSHLVNPAIGQAISGPLSVSVRAHECWLADALTKVVLNAPHLADRLLAKYDAEAFMLTA